MFLPGQHKCCFHYLGQWGICFQSKQDRKELPKGVKEILHEAERLEVKDKVPLILVELLLNENILAQVKEYRIVFLSVGVEQWLLSSASLIVVNVSYPVYVLGYLCSTQNMFSF